MARTRFMTLARHIIEGERRHPEATGELSRLLSDLSLAAKVISLEVNKAGLADILGFTGHNNVHGEKVKKLDLFAHEILIRAMDHGGHFCAIVSEEQEEIIHIPSKHKIGKYVLFFDPLMALQISMLIIVSGQFSPSTNVLHQMESPVLLRIACSRVKIKLQRATSFMALALF